MAIGFLVCVSCGPKVINYSDKRQGESRAGKYFKDKDHMFKPFLGTWEYSDGEYIFRIILWKEKLKILEADTYKDFYLDQIQGHFEIVEKKGGKVLYTSRKKMCGLSKDWPPVINAGSNDGIHLYGSVYDNSLPCDPENIFDRKGRLKMTLTSKNNITKAHWVVDIPVFDLDQPMKFNIPMDMVLTKK